MRLRPFTLLWLLGSILLASFSCTRLSVNGGGGTEWEANINGNVLDSSGAPLANVRVILLPSSYNPVTGLSIPDSLADTTDNLGHYSIITTQTGSYSIEAIDNNRGLRSLVTGVSVAGTDAVLVRNTIARIPGAIRIILPQDVDRGSGYFCVAGTTVYSFIGDDTESVVLNSVPAGVSLSLFYAVRGNAGQPQIIRQGVVVAENDTVTVAYAGWKFSKELVLNTTISGANVSGTVVEFPVLVRLTNGNFNFAEAKTGGEDVRFTKSDGTTLAFEIETWDSAAGDAAIWVKVDTVFGNNATQSITMCWGNPNAANASSSASVFDTVNGFQGVWHLGQSATGVSPDASPNHFNGTPSDTQPTAAAGIIGTCQQFDGTSNYIKMLGTASGRLNFPAHGIYTLSAWVYADTLDTLYQRIICKNNFQYKLQIDYFKTWSFAEYENAAGYELTNYPATAKAWIYLAGVRSGNAQYLYVNGACVNSTIVSQPYNAGRDTTSDVTIGRSAKTPPGDPCFFKGKIDEVRIENRAIGADWIKLCYMNQKTVDALVMFK
jgi:Concanavalin A-like lectin/glucanases superfamily/Domain of unknown function (DUF2341)